MADLGQENIAPDGQSIIENVLWNSGVLQWDSIFSTAVSAVQDGDLAIYDAPIHEVLGHEKSEEFITFL